MTDYTDVETAKAAVIDLYQSLQVNSNDFGDVLVFRLKTGELVYQIPCSMGHICECSNK